MLTSNKMVYDTNGSLYELGSLKGNKDTPVTQELIKAPVNASRKLEQIIHVAITLDSPFILERSGVPYVIFNMLAYYREDYIETYSGYMEYEMGQESHMDVYASAPSLIAEYITDSEDPDIIIGIKFKIDPNIEVNPTIAYLELRLYTNY